MPTSDVQLVKQLGIPCEGWIVRKVIDYYENSENKLTVICHPNRNLELTVHHFR